MPVSRKVDIINKLGMHARAAAKFVKLASGFDCKIDVERDHMRINGKSIMGVMMLAAAKGSSIIIHADGAGEHESLDKLEKLIKDKFDEDE